MATCLQAGAASALSFNFSFTGSGSAITPATVTGTVAGLVDNANDQTAGLTVTITSASNGPVPFTFGPATYSGGPGFDVAGGQVTGVDIFFDDGAQKNLFLGNQSNFSPIYDGPGFFNLVPSNAPTNGLTFSPVSTPVPGPLPLLGAGAAFGWSRRLKRRIRQSA